MKSSYHFLVQIEVNYRVLWLKLEVNYNISQSTVGNLCFTPYELQRDENMSQYDKYN